MKGAHQSGQGFLQRGLHGSEGTEDGLEEEKGWGGLSIAHGDRGGGHNLILLSCIYRELSTLLHLISGLCNNLVFIYSFLYFVISPF